MHIYMQILQCFKRHQGDLPEQLHHDRVNWKSYRTLAFKDGHNLRKFAYNAETNCRQVQERNDPLFEVHCSLDL